ncbi:hypothetical protein H3302_01260 [Pseudoalteromonas sp. MT33b]|uniref:hypothetical protein n=1 Tax=Pseudoalteromonas sp. MT33b TaxID=2759705 RepID=UPI0015FA954B|nr:hypothetical protein [Pseudoalteromonas sp. MT33b]QMW14780.1 hypothetical protein H3302_01260 [Pseudoalteromonas sp. MT33b]
MKLFFFYFLLLTLISNTVSAIEKDITLHLCENCSYNEAKYYANQESPNMRCESSNPKHEMTLGNEACYADSKKVIIADTQSDNHFVFLISYKNQGLPALNLEKYSQNISPASNDLSVINKVKITDKNFSTFIKEAQAQIKQQPVSSSSDTTNNFMSISETNSETCPSHIKSAVNAAYGGKTASELQTKLNHKVYRDFKNPESAFMTDKMDSTGFSLFALGFSYQGSWKKVSRNFNTIVDLPTHSDVPDSTGYKVVFNVKWIKEFRGLDVELNPLFTKFEGYTLSLLTKGGVKEISSCLEEALDQNLSHSSKTPIGSGSSHSPIFGGSSGGWDNHLCEKHYHDIQGEKIATVKVPC